MDKIQKFLLGLTKKERALLVPIFANIRIWKITTYDVKPLKGHKGLYRLRKGNIRIVFTKAESGIGIILHVGNRKDVYEKL